MSMIEADCTRCKGVFVPHGTNLEDLIHGETEAGDECGGIGIIAGEWISPMAKEMVPTFDKYLRREMLQFETHGKAEPDCADPHCVFHHPDGL